MTIDDAKDYPREHWPSIRAQLLGGTYQPQPVKRVEIPKPDGGVRKLGVPCVVDRLIQQAVLQALQERWDPTFSEHSYGFRPGRSAHQAVAQAQRYVAEGYSVVVDLDLEKFFDRVNHDSLMARVAARVTDKRVLKLIRAFLTSGVMEDGLVSPVDEGTPQGGPLSPLLSNLVLDDLDKELARRGHRFLPWSQSSGRPRAGPVGGRLHIYVRSRRAGERVMASVSRFLTRKLRLKVTEAKSAMARPEERKFLGFSISNDGSARRRRAKSPRQIQGADPGHDPPDSGDQPTAADRRPYAIPHRMARLLRLLPDPTCAHQPGSVDSPKTTFVSLAAVAERAQPLQRTAPSRRTEVQCSGRRRFADGVLRMSGPPRSNKPCVTTISTRSVSPDCLSPPKLNPVEPPWYVTHMPGGVGGVGGVAPRGVPLSRSSV
jgi:group II intron reverse transcriptase/maturase